MFKYLLAVTSAKKFICFFICSFFLLLVTSALAQQLKFNRLFNGNTTNWGGITSVAQDKQGYIWLSTTLGNGGRGGLYRYDGSNIISYLNDGNNDNSLANNWAECMIVDSSNNLWIGTWGSGLDMYNQLTQKFTHHKHDKNNPSCISNDTVTALLQDHNGNIWVGTFGGLNMLDVKTGKFTRYVYDDKNNNSISSNDVRVIYEDREGVLWVGCGSPFSGDDKKAGDGGLNRFNKATGDFTRYLHNPADTNSIENNKVRALLEDSKGNFWVGTAGDGLHILNRKTGVFTHYYYDSLHPDKLSRPPLYNSVTYDHIPFIHEDKAGFIWIGSFFEGMNRYNPFTKKVTHYGVILQDGRIASAKDTAAGFSDINNWAAFNSNDGLLWLTTLNGSLYTVNPVTTTIPYINIDVNANTFYKAPGENYLWMGTTKGLWRKDLSTGAVKTWRHDARSSNSLCNDSISAMRVDDKGNFWMTTNDGLSRFNPKTNSFVTYRHDEKNTSSLSYSYLNNLLIDHNKNIWLASDDAVVDKFDLEKNLITHYNLKNAAVICLAEDKNGIVWAGTYSGVNKINNNSVQPKSYLTGTRILNFI